MFRRTFLRLVAVAAIATACVELDVSPAYARDGDLRILLTGPGGSGSARSRVRNDRSEFQVEAEHLKLTAGAVLTVNVDGTSVGTMKVNSSGSAELDLRSDRGQMVPTIGTGSTVTVVDADGNVLMSGTF